MTSLVWARVCSLKKQLLDRDTELKERDKMRQEQKQATAREQRLIAAAFHELGFEFQTCANRHLVVLGSYGVLLGR